MKVTERLKQRLRIDAWKPQRLRYKDQQKSLVTFGIVVGKNVDENEDTVERISYSPKLIVLEEKQELRMKRWTQMSRSFVTYFLVGPCSQLLTKPKST